MKPTLLRLSALAIGVSCAGSLRSADAPPPAPEEQYSHLEQEYQTALAAYRAAVAKTSTEEERRKVIADLYPKGESYAPRFLALARQSPHTPGALDALLWVAAHDREDAPVLSEALKILAADDLESEKVVSICPGLAYATSTEVDPFLRQLLASSPHREVRGVACLVLAERIKMAASGDPAQAEKLLGQAETEYGDVPLGAGKTVGDRARSELYELHSLAAGQPAPEIEGVDVDGKPMKLSDYRGKVVMLDFWGYW